MVGRDFFDDLLAGEAVKSEETAWFGVVWDGEDAAGGSVGPYIGLVGGRSFPLIAAPCVLGVPGLVSK